MNVYQRYVVQQPESMSPPEHELFLTHTLPLYINHPELGGKELYISLKMATCFYFDLETIPKL